MNLFAVTSLLCGSFALLLAIFAFIAGRNNIYWILGFCNVGISIWGFGCFLVGISDANHMALIGWKIAHSGGFFTSVFFYHLVTIICEVRRPRWLIVGYAQAIFFNLINIGTHWMMEPLRYVFGILYIDRTFFSTLAFCTYLLFVTLSYIELSKFIVNSRDQKRRQALSIAIGFLFGFGGGTSILLPEFRIDILYPVGNIGVFVYAAIVTYAILRTKIFDIEEIAQAAHKDKLAAIGTLATSINHEIRNPLYIVKGLAESHLSNMKDGIYPDKDIALAKANEVLSKSVDQTARAIDIMKRFAMFAKQSVSQTAQLELVRLVDVMSDILPLVGHELELDKIKLTQNIPDGIVLNVDRRHIEEILFNLIVNACQAMKAHNVEGEICINAEGTNITIEDNGPGISPDDLAKIFEPFYTTKQEGTGLGLYITKQLVERNGGKILVKSKLGQGTTFRLEFK